MDAILPSNARAFSPPRADAEPPYLGDMVTVARRLNSLEAELLRGCLVADGLPATLVDAHTVQTDTLLTTALGGVRIMVPSSCAEQARQTIAAFDRGAFTLDELPEDDEAVAVESRDETSAAAPDRLALPRLTAVGAFVLLLFGLLVALGGPGSGLH
jgi:hypothetical protein